MERIEDLFINNLKIYQDDSLYCFTSDAVLLTKFTSVKNGDIVADFCSGSGIVGLHLYALNPVIKSVTLFEMQKPLYDLSVKSIKLNNLENVFDAKNIKVQDIGKEYEGKFSLIVCNPPYMKVGAGEYNSQDNIALCRAEISLGLEELMDACNRAIKFGGRINLVHRADRLSDIFYEMKKRNIEPKKIQFVRGGKKEPYLVMVEGVKGGKSGLKVLSEIEN